MAVAARYLAAGFAILLGVATLLVPWICIEPPTSMIAINTDSGAPARRESSRERIAPSRGARARFADPHPSPAPLRRVVVAIAGALIFLLFPGLGLATPEPMPEAPAEVLVEVYTRGGCGRCADAKAFLTALAHERPNVRVVERRIDTDPEARRALEEHLRQAGAIAAGVPTFVLRGEVLIGFADGETTGTRIRRLVDGPAPAAASGSGTAPPSSVCGLDTQAPCDESEAGEVETKLLGRLSVSRMGLPLFTVALGLLDGFNPCAMWVLLFLLAMLAGQRDRKRMVVTAATFVVASGAVYYAFMAAWLGIFLVVGVSHTVQVLLGVVALGIGALNVKDFFAFQRGPTLSIPASAKPGIYMRVRGILRAQTLVASAFGVAVLAVLVNTVELLCTAGLPAVYTSVLARSELDPWARASYLGLYIVAYVADDALMVAIAVATLSRRRLTETAGRWLKLVSGLVMLSLGVVLLWKPEWLG